MHPIYPDDYEARLDFSLIRDELLKLCSNEVSRHLVERMTFMTSREEVVERLEQVREIMRLRERSSEFPSLRFGNLREQLYAIRPEGAYLSVEGVAAISDLLHACDQVARLFTSVTQEEGRGQEYPYTARLVQGIDTMPDIRRRAHNLIDDEGNVKDTASKLLREIRMSLRRLESSIGATMQQILKRAQSEGWVEKDAHPTMREGRLLLPVIPSAKRDVRGIVHDESSTGRTLFIEPEQLVAMNNEIREKQGEEKREIVRLLKEFTSYLRPHIRSVQLNCMVVGTLDFAYSKGLWAVRVGGIVPRLSEQQTMEWMRARHPLLERHLKEQGKAIVPLDVTLSPKQRILVISGPNAGGKSATLKTVGLLQYMLQCGLPITLADHSTCCLFDKIFLNLGDEQSLENDLSTYSSHLLNMKFFCQHADKKTLILIDEFGSGTEPIIGGAIAEALLDNFVQKGCYGMITTHYGNLKEYSEQHDGVVNGAMLFDRQRITPLYQLFIGKPGSSFAIEISRKIGLPESILSYASNLVGSDYVMQDKYLQDIMRDKRYWEEKRAKIHKQEKEIEELKSRLKEKMDHAHREKQELLVKAEREALQILANANADVERTIKEIKLNKAEKEATKEARQKLEEKKRRLDIKLQQTEAAMSSLPSREPKQPATLLVGGGVIVEGVNEVGELLEVMKGKARVRIGNLSMLYPIKKLQPTLKKPTAMTKSTPQAILQGDDDRRLSFKPQLDCRGMRVDEALQQVTHFVDDAVRYAFSPIRILHGTGTGALRVAIRQQLNTTPVVKSFRDEHVDFGGAGITIIELDL